MAVCSNRRKSSRRGNQKMWSGPKWLQDQNRWPPDMATGANNKTESEAKVIKEVLLVAVGKNDQQDGLLPKYRLCKTLWIKSWIICFITNCRTPSKERIRAPIITIEINAQKHQLIQNAQNHGESFEAFEIQKQTLNLQRNSTGLYECIGRIQDHYPLFIPRNSMLAEKIVEDTHIRTLHGGVSLTMAEVRREYWIPRRRSLTKKIRKACYDCKRFQVTTFNNPPPGELPEDRTVSNRSRLRWTNILPRE